MKKVIAMFLSLALSISLLAQTVPVQAAETTGETTEYTPAVTSDVKVIGVNNGETDLNMELYARYNSGAAVADGGSLEIVEYNSTNGYAYAVSGLKGAIIAVKMEGVEKIDTVAELYGTEYDVKTLVETAAAESGFVYGDVTSVAISPDGTKLAAAIQHSQYDEAGKIAVFDCAADGTLNNPVLYHTGVQPDMVIFADDNTILSADEGEPREGYADDIVDPAGTVTILNLADQTSVQAGFESFQAEDLTAQNILLGVVNDTILEPAVDLEPEYIAVSQDGSKAYVSLQEANAIAVLDVQAKTFTGIYSAGFEDYSKVAVDLIGDATYNAATYENLVGARMPDGIAVYEAEGKTYVLTANEGDAREWGTDDSEFVNEVKDKNIVDGEKIRVIDDSKCAGLPEAKKVMFGGRGFTIYEVTENGLSEVYDSGNDFEAVTAKAFPNYFNCSNDDIEKDSRSAKKGPEPENVTIGEVDGKTYAFVALERIGGIIVYDVTNPAESTYANYINSRDFAAEIQGDVAPEGICFINVDNKAVLLAACEVSGTLAAYEISKPENKEIENDKTENNGTENNETVNNKTENDKTENNETVNQQNVSKVKTVKLAKTVYTYNGKNRTPKVVVKDSQGKTLKQGTDYTVTYPKSRKNVGKYTVTIQFKGNYTGTVKKTFTIKPKTTSLTKVTAKSKGIQVTWKKQATQTTGYVIQYSTSSKFTKKTTKTATCSNKKTISTKISKLKGNKKYYVRIRTYKKVKVNGTNIKIYSDWSRAKIVKTKK